MGDLRADLGRMREDLTQQLNDQLSSEMLVERIVMRTQGNRPDPGGRSVDSTASWTDDQPPRELTGGWPAIRLDEPQGTRQFHELRRPDPAPVNRRVEEMPSWARESAAFDLFGPAETTGERYLDDDRGNGASRHSRHAAEDAAAEHSPAEDAPAAPRTEMSAVVRPPEPGRPSIRPRPSPQPARVRAMPEVPNRRPRPGEAQPATGEQPSGPRPMAAPRPVVPPAAARPAVPPSNEERRPAAPPTVANPIASPSTSGTGPSTGSSVAQILAQNGGGPATGSRRQHRRYREDDEADDVLARVLREN
jgi:hypothetical protein